MSNYEKLLAITVSASPGCIAQFWDEPDKADVLLLEIELADAGKWELTDTLHQPAYLPLNEPKHVLRMFQANTSNSDLNEQLTGFIQTDETDSVVLKVWFEA